MISVVIPVYNYLVTNLVQEIYKQLINEQINFEIICLDDASTISYPENKALNQLKNVSYQVLAENIGRSRIRNLLASKANYSWLLFLDADTYPTNENFIKKYLSSIRNNEAIVFCGGIKHNNDITTRKSHKLRAVYSKKRECLQVKKRNKKPYYQLKTANLLVHQSIFSEITFCELLVDYGYEDLLFFLTLKAKNIPVIHIENPISHHGIDSNAVFIAKTNAALKNLYNLVKNDLIAQKETPLLRMHHFLKKNDLLWSIQLFSKLFLRIIKKILIFFYPNLFLLDLYKFLFYCELEIK